MKHKLLKTKKIAVVFGTFAPMHIGHVDLITRAKRENDAALVFVSGTNTKEDRGTRVGLHLKRRFRYVREVFHDDELVVVDKLDEEGIISEQNGLENWFKILHELIKENTDYQFEKITFYIGEEKYQKPLLSYFENVFNDEYLLGKSDTESSDSIIKKEVGIKIIDKSIIPVSSDEILKKPLAPVSLEYARYYQGVHNVRDDELDTNDYIRLFAYQNHQTSNIIDSGSHSGIVFVDTNATVTMAYVDYYLKDVISEEEYQALNLSYKVAVSKEKWDLIVLIPPKSAYVNDGFRDMSMSSQDIRDDFTNHLIELLKRDGFEDKLLILDSEPDTFFIENYEKTIEAIKTRLNIDI